MTDAETKVRDLLAEMANEVHYDPQLERTTLGRARRRRALVAALTVAVVVAVGIGGLTTVRELGGPPVTAGGDVTPTPSGETAFAGLWPETDRLALDAAQAQVDLGHQPWRLDPVTTAQALSADFLGWPPDDFGVDHALVEGDHAKVTIVDRLFGDPVPPVTIALQQLGRTGPDGIWSVVAVSSPLIELDPVASLPDGSVRVSGGIAGVLFEPASIGDAWAPEDISVVFVDGATLDSEVAGGVLPLDHRFEGSWPAAGSDESLVAWVRVLDGMGRALGAVALPVSVQGEVAETPAPQPLPEAVARTRAAIVDAAVHGDFDALRTLIDPDHFAYNFDDGSDPTPIWKQRPLVLDTFVKLLDMPFVVRESSTAVVYIWPYFMDADLTSLTPEEYDLLGTVGVTRKDVEAMIAFGGYTGPRLGIVEDGTWVFYTEGGD